MPRRLTRNAVRCGRCRHVIESRGRHQCVWCRCGGVMVDGGLAYQRIGWKDGVEYEDLAEFEVVPCGRCGKAADVEFCDCLYRVDTRLSPPNAG